MANATINLSITKSGYVKKSDPYTVFKTNSSTEYQVSSSWDDYFMFFGMPAMPTNLRHNALVGISITAAARFGTSQTYGLGIDSCEDFDVNTLNYNNMPSVVSTGISTSAGSDASGTLKNHTFSSPTNTPQKIAVAFKKKGLRCSGNQATYGQTDDYKTKVKTVLANGSTRPYVTITYDDSTKVLSNIAYRSGPTSGSKSSATATTFSWDYERASSSAYCADETWSQTSATFYWKKSTESNYHSVAVSGNTKTVTIAANTFPTGSTIQWYVRGTDEDNTTTQTSVYSFATYATQITPDIYPSGNNVDNRTAKSFTWHFASTGGNYAQQSATLYWRVQGASSWNTIAASGTTQSLSVPAYTFPSGSTIEWYLSGTDATGGTSTSETKTFETLDYTLAVTTAPSGSGVATNTAISFVWTLNNTQGAVTQKSAKLYWRVQGASTYNEIVNSTGTKSISIPANTFPTSSTIQWYLSVTANDNTVKTTSATTFTTVSPTVTPTIYPSGNDVYSGADITFKWKLASSAGDYAQKSAVFYWRLTTSEEYRTISISGNTQQVTIPALTFPTNATVYWYITAVDAGNHSSSTSVQNFKTSTTQITPQSSPTSGYTNPRNPITFSWYFAASGGSIPQSSASLYWRVQGELNWTQVVASGSTTSVTIAANTFPVASVIEWYIAGSDSSGTSSQSSVYSFSTTASTVYAVVKSPVNSGVDGSAPITFQWTLTTADGYPANRVILQWKLPTEDDQHWHTIIDSNTAITQYTVDGSTFQPGEINWRVRAYNVDSVEGVGTSASFVCVIAPTITTLSATNVPFSVVSWQAVDQQGYLLEIDGVKFGPYPGTEKQFAVPDYFRDGVHTIRLRVLGTVDLWSDWAETSVSIENVPGNPITAEATSDINVLLEWQSTDADADFYIYRDEKLIGRTGNTKFVDRFSIGTHEYTVINRLASGNYSVSNTLTETTAVEYMYLSTVDGLADVNVIYRLKGNADPVHKNSRETYLNKLSGHSYSAMTKSRFLDHVIDCSAVFLYTEAEKNEQFQKLLGEEVVAKLSDGTCCVAVIESYTRKPKKTYYTAYEFTLHQIEWEDFDDTQ